MIRRPPRSTRTDTLFPYTTLFRSTAAVLGLVLVVVTLAVLSGESLTRRSTSYHRLHSSGARQAPITPLGRWRWPVFGLLCALVAVALVIPMAVIVTWLLRGLDAGEPLRLTTELVGNKIGRAHV